MKILGVSLSVLVLLTALPSSAHVSFTSPADRATLAVGAPVTITWVDAVVHEGVGYDLEATSGPLALGLSTRTHSYVWTPTVACVPCVLRITQVNVAEDYTAEITVSVMSTEVGGGGTGGSGAAGSAAAGASSAGATSGGAPTKPSGGSMSGGSGAASTNEGGAPGSTPTDSSGTPSPPAGGTAGGEEASPGGESGFATGGDLSAGPSEPAEVPSAGAMNADEPSADSASCRFGRGGSRSSALLALLLGGALRLRPRFGASRRILRA